MNWLKKAWDWLCGAVKDLLTVVCDTVLDRAKEIIADKEVVNLALEAIQAAALEGLTGEKAWAKARNRFVVALKDAGKDLGNCAIDTTLQLVYDAWKNRKV